MPDDSIVLDSLARRIRAMHSLWEQAVTTMGLAEVNHVEREAVLPIAFSLFHFVNIEDISASSLGAGPVIFDDTRASQVALGVSDHGKQRSVSEMMAQRIGDYDAFVEYMTDVFAKTEGWLGEVDPASLSDVVVRRPFPAGIASTYSARVAGPEGITRLDATECWIYQHGLRHMGEVEHARSLVGLGGMTS